MTTARPKLIAAVALLGLPLASCGEATPPPPPAGSIVGQVTVDGAGFDGVSVGLSGGASTATSGGGTYRFSDLDPGAYTVAISGYPVDVWFDQSSAHATIPEAGGSVAVDFAGEYDRTQGIGGSVTVEGYALPGGAVVSLAGGPEQVARDTALDKSSKYYFFGLRVGSYTVEISDFDTTVIVFAETKKHVALEWGELKNVSFDGKYR